MVPDESTMRFVSHLFQAGGEKAVELIFIGKRAFFTRSSGQQLPLVTMYPPMASRRSCAECLLISAEYSLHPAIY